MHKPEKQGSRRPIDLGEIESWPVFADDEIAAALAVLRSGKVNYWTGTQVRNFESAFADYCGRRHALAVCSGTVGLEMALLALGIGSGDDVIVTPRSFIASATSIIRAGARPVFADVCPDSQNLTAATIKAALTPRTRAVMLVHLGGWPCALDAIEMVCEEHDLLLIEDGSQAHGARYRGQLVGSVGAASVFSFCQDKIMTTAGEGGILLTDDREVWRRAYALRDSGRDAEEGGPAGDGEFVYCRESIGSNYRLSEIQAAVGLAQLVKIDGWLDIRRRHAGILSAKLQALNGVRLPVPPADVEHSYYRYFVFVQPEHLNTEWTLTDIISELRARGVPCQQGICPEIYRERAIAKRGFAPSARLPVAQQLGQTGFALPVHPGLTETQVRAMGDIVYAVLERATQ